MSGTTQSVKLPIGSFVIFNNKPAIIVCSNSVYYTLRFNTNTSFGWAGNGSKNRHLFNTPVPTNYQGYFWNVVFDNPNLKLVRSPKGNLVNDDL